MKAPRDRVLSPGDVSEAGALARSLADSHEALRIRARLAADDVAQAISTLAALSMRWGLSAEQRSQLRTVVEVLARAGRSLEDA